METFNDQLAEEEVVAIVSAAVTELIASRRRVESELEQDSTTWRFSGRWWNQPIAIGRKRPSRF